MGKDTAIGWCHHTHNPWWGCVEVSPACDACYAREWALRFGFGVWGADAPRRFFGDKHWREPLTWNAAALAAGERRRVFCASMADVAEHLPPSHPSAAAMDAARARLWALIHNTEQLDWLLLTKRPERLPHIYPAAWLRNPPMNVWAGTTIEDRVRLALRYERLRAVPAHLRFFSMEPLLEDLPEIDEVLAQGDVHWCIVGGESGRTHRLMPLDGLARIADVCRRHGVALYVKQDSGVLPGDRGRIPDALWVREFPDGERRAA